MCDLTKEFKLCSCDGANLSPSEIGWILRRKNEQKEIRLIQGKPAIQKLSENETQLKTAITQQLNERNCFDFEYTPQTDDFLTIKTTEPQTIWFAFRYQQGEWKEDDSTEFSHWRMQLEAYQEGKIKN